MRAIAKPNVDVALLTAAFRLAAETHRHQLRKGTSIPYMAHLLGVAESVWTAEGSDLEAAAALLHDAVEDGGGSRLLAEIRRHCGDKVAAIVEGCSDSQADTAAGEQKADWLTRKQTYVERLRDAPQSVLLVSVCDKLYNLSATYADYERDDDSIWGIFNKDSGWRGQVWYYNELLGVYQQRGDKRVRKVAARLAVQLALLRALLVARDHDPSDLDFPFVRS